MQAILKTVGLKNVTQNVQQSHACNCKTFNCKDVAKKVAMILILISMLNFKIRFKVGVRSMLKTQQLLNV